MGNHNSSFKQCPMCEFTWDSREEFLGDSNIELIGYQVNFKNLPGGFFLLNHSTCGTSLAVMVDTFQDFYDGPIYEDCATGGEDCPKYCLYQNELRRCLVKCECAYVRQIIQIIKFWPKKLNL